VKFTPEARQQAARIRKTAEGQPAAGAAHHSIVARVEKLRPTAWGAGTSVSADPEHRSNVLCSTGRHYARSLFGGFPRLRQLEEQATDARTMRRSSRRPRCAETGVTKQHAPRDARGSGLGAEAGRRTLA